MIPLAHRPMARRRVRAAVAIALAGLAAAAWLSVRGRPHGVAVVWASLMLASFVGWGSLVNLWLAPDRRADWGLRAGWGMALFILTGGFLTAAHLTGRASLVIHVLVGVGALLAVGALHRGDRPLPLSRRRLVATLARGEVLVLVALAYGLAAFMAVAVLGEHWFCASDDQPFYLMLPEKLIQTGSLLEPFSARRSTTSGAPTYLSAAFFAVSTPYYAWIVDEGLGVMVTVALLVGHVKRGGIRARQWLPLGLTLLLFFSLVSCRRNTASLFTGVAAFVTLFRTVRTPLARGADPPAWPMQDRRAIALGALTCVAVLLRTSNAAAALPFVVLVLACDYLLATRRPWSAAALRPLGRTAAVLAGAFFVALAPWSVMLAQSCGAPFFPFGHSNITPGWTLMKHAGSLGALGKKVVEDMFFGAPLAALLPFFVAGLAPLRGKARNDLVAFTVASLVGVVALARLAAAFGPDDTARYYFGYVVAMALLTTASAGGRGPLAAVVAACVGMHLAATRDSFHRTMATAVDEATKAVDDDKDRRSFEALTGVYRDVQSHVPPGATMVTAVNEGDRFDFTRNRIFSLDYLGGMGPKPGWPLHRGPEALARYLAANGVAYVVWVDFNGPSEFYNRSHWHDHLTHENFRDTYLPPEAAIAVDAASSIDKLAAIRRVVYRAHDMTVVDLTSPPDPAAPR